MSNSHPVPDGLTPDLDPAFERIPGSAGYGSAFGPTFHMLAADHCLVAFKVGPEHLNHRGVCHGGALLTFADIALSCPARMGQRSNQTFETTAHLSLDFVSPARTGEWVVANARVLRRGRHLVFTEATLLVGERIVANASAIFAILAAARRS